MSSNGPTPNHPDSERSIDERLAFLAKSIESHDEQLGKLIERVDRLADTSERHEREINRFRAAMRAALQAWLAEGSAGEPQS